MILGGIPSRTKYTNSYPKSTEEIIEKKTFDKDTNTMLHWSRSFIDASILSETKQVSHYRYHILAIPDVTVYKTGFNWPPQHLFAADLTEYLVFCASIRQWI